ncbi:zf-HC2 domain-containing protein [Streptomyces liangshanensis]|uniref:Zf-HC2 domain-containing protein n=1 Tax=Streptomyces liangshanensis TaxID=2717324 RepID=A0A6G9GT36_9ACTN|nr:zf-HC2 domain-containing protein [Streptomyces liangshanensis]QIQ01408.1 zf-HC2 domain-containing protein [Streptomyces liangshanensis]
MRTLDLHRDVGAYSLGVLDAADAFRFEDHLMECPQCTLLLADFGGVKAQLDEYSRRTPAEVAPFAAASPGLLAGLIDRTAEARRRGHRRRLALVAAVAVLVAGGPLAVLLAADSAPGSSRVATASRWTATDPVTGTKAAVTALATTWGTDVGLEMLRSDTAGVCALVAVGRDGSRQTVTTWEARADAAMPLVTRGGAALPPEGIDHFEVRTADGVRLVSLGGMGREE